MLRSRVLTVVALVIGAAPGLLLPVMIIWRLPLISAAALLLTITFTQIAFAALGTPYETTMLVRLGTAYGVNNVAPRFSFLKFATQAVTRVGPFSIFITAALVTSSSLLSPDVEVMELIVLAIPMTIGLLIQVSSTPLSAYLYAVRRFPSVYFATFFLGGPSLVIALLWPNAFAISLTYFVGHILRWLYLAWRVNTSERKSTQTNPTVIDPPRWAELSPQALSSLTGQLMPFLAQILVAFLGATAVAASSIAFRVWGAAWQVGAATLAMPAVVTLTHQLFQLEAGQLTNWISRRALRLVAVSTGLALVGASMVTLLAVASVDFLPPTVVVGLWWSLISVIAFPFGMLNLWAGRGLVTIDAGWWLPVLTFVGFFAGGLVSAVTVSYIGGVGVIIGFTVGMIVQGMSTGIVFRQRVTKNHMIHGRTSYLE